MNRIPDLLSKQAQSQPDAIALMAPKRLPLTYGDLYAHVIQIVHSLNDYGIGHNDRVAIVLPNGLEMAVAFLGVAAGATSAPLNPAYGAKEFDFYLADLQAKALLIHAELDSPARSVAQAHGIPIIDCKPLGEAGIFKLGEVIPKGHAAAGPYPDQPSFSGLAAADDVALVLHTSGTTARPKLVPLTQRNLCTSARHIVRTLQLTAQDRCLNVMPLFHIHGLMAATLASLMAGAQMVCTPGFDAEQFFAWIEAFEPTWYTAVPTMHQAVLAGAATHHAIIARHRLRFIRSSSASLPPKVMAGLEEAFNAPVIESYGMTEAGHQMTSNPLPPSQRKPGSVGIAAGPEVAIMDEASPSFCKQGEVGEIVIRGANVTLGYANNPEANQQAFTNGWFRTGDQGYFDADGYLFITGRLKEMINRGGEKIAPREVDEVLLAHPDVKQAITFALPHESLGEDVAAAVILKEDATVTANELRRFAFSQLTAHKVPTQILLVDELPKGPTGKLQRIGLAEKLADQLKARYVAPSTPLEEALAAIWAEVLGQDRVGIGDNFFALGGDSLSAAQILGKIQQQLQRSLPLTTFLQAVTIADLAAAIDASHTLQGDEEQSEQQFLSIEHAQRFAPFALTDTQQAYWIGRTGLFEGGKVAHHHYLELEGIGLAVKRLEQAWQQMIERHDMLRAFILPDGQQQVLEHVPPYQITLFDPRHAHDESRTHLREIRQAMSHQIIPSDRWPLFDIRASLLPDERVRLHISFDGLIADAWSRRLLLAEWGHFYAKPEVPLPPLALTFRDYVNGMLALKSSVRYKRDQAYWQQRLATLPPAPALPQSKHAPLVDARFVRQEREVVSEIWQQLKGRGQAAGISSAALLLTIYSDILAVWSHEQQFTINVARFDRQQWHPQMEDLVGQFGSFTLLAVHYEREETFVERARRLQKQLWQDMAHSSFSGVQVLRELGQAHGQLGAITMPIVFTMYAAERRSRAHASSLLDEGDVIFSANQTPQVWLDFHVYETGNTLQCDWDAVEEIFPDGLMPSMFEATLRSLHRLATDDASWQELWTTTAQQIVPTQQLAQREVINRIAMPVPDALLQTGFSQQAQQRPSQPALITPTKTFTYQELYALSNHWAHYLRDLGAQPNTLVAVVMEKGWEQVVAVLAILQSGAAYLPIDTSVPPERLAYLLQQSNIELVLTQSWLSQQLVWPAGVQQMWIDRAIPLARPGNDKPVNDQPLLAPQSPDDLAVVIYTSGSTGVPKGVMLTHRSLLNSIAYTKQRFGISANDAVLALTALHHDMSIFDLFGLLSAGGTIVMPAAPATKDPAHWLTLIEQHQVSLWNSVPAMMEMLLAYTESHPTTRPLPLRLTFLGGDWIPLSLPQRLWDLAPKTEMISVGGPTETSLWNIMFPIDKVDPTWSSIPYGRPIANNRYYVLNEALADCPTWVAGELYCAGTGVAAGYWQDDTSSHAKFFVHPRTSERLCRTGDVGRYLPDGTIEFLGRRDAQVKINGQRIELGEIEAMLQRHPAIQRAVVLAQKKQLVAFLVAQDGQDGVVDTVAVESFLRAKLPDYMVPTQLMRLDELPLTVNGKIDRRRLADLANTAVMPTRQPDEPANIGAGLERQVAALIAAILAVEAIDANANLFYLGVNSIDMVRIGNRIEEQFGLRLRMDQLFRLTSANAIANFIKGQLPTAVAPPLSDYQTLVSSYQPLLTPAEREAFKNSRPGLRAIEEGARTVQLAKPELNDEQRERYQQRRSVRLFSLKPIALEQFGQFLRCLSPLQVGGQLKYRWGSPGGLYPIQTYLHLKAGRVQALQGGIYYYHPIHHRLVLIAADVTLASSIHAPFINSPIFAEAAFSLFLIAEFAAIAPAYGERSLHLATLEAGSIAHLLETEAPNYGLGLCQIGSIDFDKVRHLFQLNASQQLIHSLLGGSVDPNLAPVAMSAQTKAARLLERIHQLSDEEAKQLLAAHRR
ncbi:MAG: amino acid adenylation domain-containing protein [Caldilineaceae bacterium]